MIRHWRASFLGACREFVGDQEGPTSKIILVGEDNPQSDRDEHALYDEPDGVAGHRLRTRVLGITSERYRSIWRANLCTPIWSSREARIRAEVLSGVGSLDDGAAELPWKTMVLLGAKVAATFSRVLAPGDVNAFTPFWSWHWSAGDIMFTCLPHPSGRCRSWNDPDSYRKARHVLRSIAPEIPWGETDA